MRPRLERQTWLLALVPAAALVALATSGADARPLQNASRSPGDIVDARNLYESGLSGARVLARLSATGRLAAIIARARAQGGARIALKVTPEDGDEESTPIPGGQAETAIAVDATGLNVVVGFNDNRGSFLAPPTSISGFAWSSDGGVTFAGSGRLPVAKQGTLGTEAFPQIHGDPDVQYVPGGAGCQFIYSSIASIGIGGSGSPPDIVYTGEADTLTIHRSTDCGHTWTGPFIVTAATNPTGVLVSGNARDVADKEFIDVDPASGRVLMGWSNFTEASVIPGGVEIRAAYSDDIMTGNPPTWSSGVVVNPGSASDDQGAAPRFSGDGKAYIAWDRSVAGESTPYGKRPYGNIMFSRSLDNGQTWSAPIKLHTGGTFPVTGDFFPVDHVPGNDRIHSDPSMAVDRSGGAANGNIYVVYAGNDSRDGGDIHFVKSTNAGVSFSAPVRLNSRPGSDRSQWFPSISVTANGRIYAIFYDQQYAATGDLTEMTMTYSDNAGATWTRPSPISARPFHAGYGNDNGQPNLGDYIGSTTHGNQLYGSWASTPPEVLYTDGQPTFPALFTVPDVDFAQTSVAALALKLGTVVAAETAGFSNGNGFFDPGERIDLTLPLINYVTNPVTGAGSYAGISATLSTSTAGVVIVSGGSSYGPVAAGGTESNESPFVIRLPGNIIAGTRVELALNVQTASGSAVLPFTLSTGTPVVTPLLSENFNATTVGSLPAGWTTEHIGPAAAVPWTTGNTFCNTATNALFHVNTGDASHFEVVNTPNFSIPATTAPQLLTLDFDICYETEDDPDFNVNAFDGATVQLVDITPGRFPRSVLAEAFARTIQTGNAPPFANHFPKHLPTSSIPSYFQDMSVWAGSSGGMKHVHIEYPGTQGSTVRAQWVFTQDGASSCIDAGHAGYGGVCGVLVDNVVFNAVTYNPALVDPYFSSATASPSMVTPGTTVTYTFVVATSGSGFNAANVVFTDPLPAGETFVSLASPAGWNCTTPAVGTNGSISCTHPSLASGTTASFTIVAGIPATASGGVVNNTATLTTESPETSTNDNFGTASFTIVPSADLVATNSAAQALIAGSDYAYAINVQNLGPSTAANATLAFPLPGPTTFVSLASPAGWICTTPAVGSGGTVNCSLAAFLAGASGAFTLTAHVPLSAADLSVLSGTATAGSATDDPVSGNNAATAMSTVLKRVLDIDGNLAYDALTDGLLIVRHMLGVSGPPLVAGLVGPGAARMDSTSIGNYLNLVHPLLDIDLDGNVDAATDGVLIIRYLLGVRGNELTQGALGANPGRTPAQIKSYLDTLAQ